jgi:hypothetical protein
MRNAPESLDEDGNIALLMRTLHLQVANCNTLADCFAAAEISTKSQCPPLPQALLTIPFLSSSAPHLVHNALAFALSKKNLHVSTKPLGLS